MRLLMDLILVGVLSMVAQGHQNARPNPKNSVESMKQSALSKPTIKESTSLDDVTGLHPPGGGSKGPRNSCAMPNVPLVTQRCLPGSDLGDGACAFSLNTYANGSTVCVVHFIHENCPDCKSGWRHRCESGTWRPTEECLPNEKKLALQREAGQAPDVSPSNQARSLAGAHGPDKSARSNNNSNSGAGSAHSGSQVVSASAVAQCGERSPDTSDLKTRFDRAMSLGGIGSSQATEAFSIRQTITSILAKCDLEMCIQATRDQIAYNKGVMSNCEYSNKHQAACDILQIGIDGNQRFLDWLLCYRGAKD